jgi:hypothetical protein
VVPQPPSKQINVNPAAGCRGGGLTRPERHKQYLTLSSDEYQNAWNCNKFMPPHAFTWHLKFVFCSALYVISNERNKSTECKQSCDL